LQNYFVSYIVSLLLYERSLLASGPGLFIEAGASSFLSVGVGSETHDSLSRHRRTGPETLQRDGTQELGLGDGQGRSGEGQTRHASLVSAADSLLGRAVHSPHPPPWARRMLTTSGQVGRAGQAEPWDAS